MSLSYNELLKFRLLAGGVRVHDTAQRAWRERFIGPLTLAEYATTSGVTLVLPGDLYVNAPLTHSPDAPELRHVDDGFFVVCRAPAPCRSMSSRSQHSTTAR